VTARRAAILVALALLAAGVVAPASGSRAAPRAGSAVAKQTCAKRQTRARRPACRHARMSAGWRRGPASGRALLAPRTSRPGAAAGTGVTATPGLPGQTSPPAGVPPAPGSSDPPAPVASTIGAEAYDFGSFVLRLTKPSVPAGQLTIYFRNYDVSEHNLWIEPPDAAGTPTQISAAVGEGGGATKTVAVSPGTWRLYCSLPGHEAMTRDLAVQ
jgi:hypothetical protein